MRRHRGEALAGAVVEHELHAVTFAEGLVVTSLVASGMRGGHWELDMVATSVLATRSFNFQEAMCILGASKVVTFSASETWHGRDFSTRSFSVSQA